MPGVWSVPRCRTGCAHSGLRSTLRYCTGVRCLDAITAVRLPGPYATRLLLATPVHHRTVGLPASQGNWATARLRLIRFIDVGGESGAGGCGVPACRKPNGSGSAVGEPQGDGRIRRTVPVRSTCAPALWGSQAGKWLYIEAAPAPVELAAGRLEVCGEGGCFTALVAARAGARL